MEPKMDQLNLKEDPVNDCEAPGANIVMITEYQIRKEDFIKVCYSKRAMSRKFEVLNKFEILPFEGFGPEIDKESYIKMLNPTKYMLYKMMSMDTALSYITSSKIKHILFESPETPEDVNYIKKITDSCKDKLVSIQSSFGEDSGITAPLWNFAIQKCLEVEKNTITFRYVRAKFKTLKNPERLHEIDLFLINSKLNNYFCKFLYKDNFLFQQLVESLKAVKNRKQLVEIVMDDNFKKLFEAMEWKLDERMINWIKEDFKDSDMIMKLDESMLDNNQYTFCHDDFYAGSDTDSEDTKTSISEDGYSSLSEDSKSEDEEPKPKESRLSDYAQNVKPAEESSCYMDENEKSVDPLSSDANDMEMRIVEARDPDDNSIDLHYSERIVVDDEHKRMSREDVMDHMKTSKKKFIKMHDPESLADMAHMKGIIDICKDKIIWVTSCWCEENGMTRPLLKLTMKKCLEKENNTIIFQYTKGKHVHSEDQLSEKLLIESQSNKFYCELVCDKKSLFPSLVKCLKALRNKNLTIDIQMESDFDKLLETMNWTCDDGMADFMAKKEDFYDEIVFDGEGKPRDNNCYSFAHYFEDEETVSCESTMDNSTCVIEELDDVLGTPNAATLVDAGYDDASENMVEAPEA